MRHWHRQFLGRTQLPPTLSALRVLWTSPNVGGVWSGELGVLLESCVLGAALLREGRGTAAEVDGAGSGEFPENARVASSGSLDVVGNSR